jgi:hypothetical protein
MVRYACVLGLLLLAEASPARGAACTAERARYVQAGGGFTAALVYAGSYGTAASNLFFKVEGKGRQLWFRFQTSNGYGGIYLEPISDPDTANKESGPASLATGEESGDAQAIAFIPYRSNLIEIADPPQAGDAPPPVIVLPGLGVLLWYGFDAADGVAQRVAMSRSAFQLARCGKAGSAARPR